MSSNIEKRKFERFLFSENVKVVASLAPSGSGEAPFDAEIKNLSKGGIGLKIKDTAPDIVHEGDEHVIIKINGMEALQFLINTRIITRWVMTSNPKEGIRSGCEFLDISETVKNGIDAFINAEMNQKLVQSADERD